MTAGSCPHCGTQRQGNLRYCASCRFDFSTAAASGPLAATTPLDSVIEELRGSLSDELAAPFWEARAGGT